MIYQAIPNTPPNTLVTSPLVTKLKMTKGLIYKVRINFPPGSCGLLGVAIKEKDTFVYPSTDEEYFYGDNVDINFDDTKLMSDPDYSLDIYTYNLDTMYYHKVTINIGLLNNDDLLIRYLPKDSSAELLSYLKENVDKKESEKIDYVEIFKSLMSEVQ